VGQEEFELVVPVTIVEQAGAVKRHLLPWARIQLYLNWQAFISV
jgi:hypothetical protein